MLRFTRTLSGCMFAVLLLAACAGAPSTGHQQLRIALVGDSTQTERQGYGLGFCANLLEQVACLNRAKGGASTKTYRRDGLWDAALATRPNWMLIQFGHNDVPSSAHNSRETDLATEYPANLRRYVTEARAAGIQPVLVTPIARQYFGADGKIHDDLMGHVAAMQQVATEMQVPLLDLHALSVAYLEKIGAAEGFALGANKRDANGSLILDKTHLNLAGSYVFGRMLAEAMGRTLPELAQYVKPLPAVAQ